MEHPHLQFHRIPLDAPLTKDRSRHSDHSVSIRSRPSDVEPTKDIRPARDAGSGQGRMSRFPSPHQECALLLRLSSASFTLRLARIGAADVAALFSLSFACAFETRWQSLPRQHSVAIGMKSRRTCHLRLPSSVFRFLRTTTFTEIATYMYETYRNHLPTCWLERKASIAGINLR